MPLVQTMDLLRPLASDKIEALFVSSVLEFSAPLMQSFLSFHSVECLNWRLVCPLSEEIISEGNVCRRPNVRNSERNFAFCVRWTKLFLFEMMANKREWDKMLICGLSVEKLPRKQTSVVWSQFYSLTNTLLRRDGIGILKRIFVSNSHRVVLCARSKIFIMWIYNVVYHVSFEGCLDFYIRQREKESLFNNFVSSIANAISFYFSIHSFSLCILFIMATYLPVHNSHF